MPYVGNSPANNFASVTKDTFSGDGSTVAFTLSKAATTNGVAVFVENVRQEPTTAYAVSGTTLTFTAAPVSASGNNIYVLHHNAPASTATHPAAQDLTCAGFTSTGIDDNADATSITIDSSENVGIKTTTPTNYYADDLVVTAPDEGGITIVGGTTERNYLAFADGTSGDARYRGLISYDHNTDFLTLGAGGSGSVVLNGDGIMTNSTQPCFLVSITGTQSNMALATAVTVVANSEIIDKNGDFSSNTFTAPVTGTYFFNVFASLKGVPLDARYINLFITGSNRNHQIYLQDPAGYDSDPEFENASGSAILDMDANDTASLTFYQPDGNQSTDIAELMFSGFLIA